MSTTSKLSQQTQTTAFKAWFEGSKLADEHGNPIMMYHGSRPGVDITTFEMPNELDGVYFTPDPLYAEGFTNEMFSKEPVAGSIFPTYLSIKNPYVVTADPGEAAWESFVDRGVSRKDMEAQGYDGAILIERSTGVIDQVQAYQSSQIKSAVGNVGSFDPTIADIRYARSDPRYMFVGPQSETSDLMLLSKAREMEKANSGATHILNTTGWMRGADGRWRYEISDHEAQIKIGVPQSVEDDALNRVYQDAEFEDRDNGLVGAIIRKGYPDHLGCFGKTKEEALKNLVRALVKRDFKGIQSARSVDGERLTLEDVLDHPKLYAAYPYLKEQPLYFDCSLQANDMGVFDWEAGITINGNMNLDDILSTLIHEIQHAIQLREGYGRGGAPVKRFTDSVKQRIESLPEQHQTKIEHWMFANKSLLDEQNRAVDMLTYGLMYQSMKRLQEHAHRDRPSGVLRLIRNEMQWVYHEKITESPLKKAFDDMERNWYNLPKRHKMAARNMFLRDQCMEAANLLGQIIPRPIIEQLKKDERQLRSMINALERDALKASKNTRQLRELRQAHKGAKKLKERHSYSTSFDVYKALAGEIEARNTETRLKMTPEERKKKSPEMTADIPSDEAIIVISGKSGSTIEIPHQSHSIRVPGFFREAPPTNEGMTKAEAQYISNSLMADWKGRPDIKAVSRVSELPLALQKDVWKNRATHDMRAAFWKNTVYLIAPRLPNRFALEEVLLHEVIGHHGLRNLLGEKLEPTLESIFTDMGHSPTAEAIKKLYFREPPFNQGNSEHRQLVAEELMAKLAESGKHREINQWDRYEADTRAGLRALGFELPLTQKDLLNLLHGAEQVVRHGGISRPSTFDTRFRRAFHGSPYQFDAFSLEAVGTGEGAQAYGWGLYFASQRRVAQWYQSALSELSDAPVFLIDGEVVNTDNNIALRTAMYQINEHGQAKAYTEITEIANRLMAEGVEIEPIALETIAIMKSLKGKQVVVQEGYLYETEIPDDSDLLCWEKPLSDQPPSVIQAIQDSGVLADTGNEAWPVVSQLMDGNEFYESIKQWFVADDRAWKKLGKTPDDVRNVSQAASEYLNKLGIPGLRYLNGGSRKAGAGEYNYVIWDNSVVSIKAVNDEVRQANNPIPDANPTDYITPSSKYPVAEETKVLITLLTDTVNQAYESGNTELAEELESRLETLLDNQDHGLADTEGVRYAQALQDNQENQEKDNITINMDKVDDTIQKMKALESIDSHPKSKKEPGDWDDQTHSYSAPGI